MTVIYKEEEFEVVQVILSEFYRLKKLNSNNDILDYVPIKECINKK